MFDVFFSHRRSDLTRTRPLLDALADLGVRVWRDQTDIPDTLSISQEIRRALAASKILLAFYSSTYPLSRPCQQEMTDAWLAAHKIDDQPFRRVLLINPERDVDHVPKALRDQQMLGWADDASAIRTLADVIRRHVQSLDGTLTGADVLPPPRYYGMTPADSTRFVGRVRELWDLHGELTANRMHITSGLYGQAVTRLRGLGGIGKSLLAREYAIRFGRAYPGGVFWINAYGDGAAQVVDDATREASRQDQLRAFSIDLGMHVENLGPDEIESAFWRRLEHEGRPCLWIADDVPFDSELEPEAFHRRWIARWTGGSTLVTTRGRSAATLGSQIDLGRWIRSSGARRPASRRSSVTTRWRSKWQAATCRQWASASRSTSMSCAIRIVTPRSLAPSCGRFCRPGTSGA
jgi:hypothetical protein